MRLVLVVPGLLALPRESLARSRPLKRLAAGARVRPESDLDAALLAAVGAGAAAAPLAALGSGLDVGTRWVARADPVTMEVGRDDVRLRARVDDLDADEVRELASLVSAHFAGDGIAFEGPRSDAWFVLSDRAFDVATTPLDAAVDKPLRPLLPRGRDAARWRRWLTEVEMLLHEHPLAQRANPVNALWLSHPGMLGKVPRMRVFAGVARAADVAHGIASVGKADVMAPSLEAAIASGEDGIVVADPADAIDASIAPALDALDARRIAALDVVADGGGTAGVWSASRASWLQRLTTRDARFDADAAVIEDRT